MVLTILVLRHDDVFFVEAAILRIIIMKLSPVLYINLKHNQSRARIKPG